MTILARLYCRIAGHARGKRVVYTVGGPESDGEREYACPRCGATWTRKIARKKKEPA